MGQGRLEGRKIGRNWVTTRKAVATYARDGFKRSKDPRKHHRWSVWAEDMDEQIRSIVTAVEVDEQRVVSGAVGEPSVDTGRLQERRKRIARAYGDGGYSESEYRARLAEIDAEIRSAVPLGMNDITRAQELVANLDLLWDKLTPRERARAVGALIEDAYVSISDSLVGAIVPKPRFRSLLEAAVGTGPGGGIELIPPGGLALVEMRGFEPLTFALRTRRSPN